MVLKGKVAEGGYTMRVRRLLVVVGLLGVLGLTAIMLMPTSGRSSQLVILADGDWYGDGG